MGNLPERLSSAAAELSTPARVSAAESLGSVAGRRSSASVQSSEGGVFPLAAPLGPGERGSGSSGRGSGRCFPPVPAALNFPQQPASQLAFPPPPLDVGEGARGF